MSTLTSTNWFGLVYSTVVARVCDDATRTDVSESVRREKICPCPDGLGQRARGFGRSCCTLESLCFFDCPRPATGLPPTPPSPPGGCTIVFACWQSGTTHSKVWHLLPGTDMIISKSRQRFGRQTFFAGTSRAETPDNGFCSLSSLFFPVRRCHSMK